MDALYLDFVNSEFRDFRGRWVRDDLQQTEWLETFLLKWGLQVDELPNAATRATLIALRTLLYRVIETLIEGQITDSNYAELNVVLLKGTLSRHLVKDTRGCHVDMVPVKRDWDWVQAEVVASFASMLAYQDPKRLKICANANCRWVFYDESKSRTKQYCTSNKCANLVKVRRFRARHTNTLSS